MTNTNCIQYKEVVFGVITAMNYEVAVVLDLEPHNLVERFIFREIKGAGGERQDSLKHRGIPAILYSVNPTRP